MLSRTPRASDVVVQVPHETLVAVADPVALRTVVDHLIDNAIKYSDGGLVVVAVKHESDEIEVSVSDIGIGMDEDQARHCFEKFWQAESTDGRRYGGTGIGLYIVSSMVEAMGGTIWVETAVGQGSTFTVSLPTVVPVPGGPGSGADPSVEDRMREPHAILRGAT